MNFEGGVPLCNTSLESCKASWQEGALAGLPIRHCCRNRFIGSVPPVANNEELCSMSSGVQGMGGNVEQ